MVSLRSAANKMRGSKVFGKVFLVAIYKLYVLLGKNNRQLAKDT